MAHITSIFNMRINVFRVLIPEINFQHRHDGSAIAWSSPPIDPPGDLHPATVRTNAYPVKSKTQTISACSSQFSEFIHQSTVETSVGKLNGKASVSITPAKPA
jgi:hypothetical protein